MSPSGSQGSYPRLDNDSGKWMTLVRASAGHLIGTVTYFLPRQDQHRLESGDFFFSVLVFCG